MDEAKKAKATEIADLPDGLKELAEMPKDERSSAIILPPPQSKEVQRLPAAAQQASARPKTPKEQELGALISKRQEIIEKLKAKNPQVLEARKKIAESIPAIRGAGASHTMKLAAEAEHIEFSIATEAYTPKKEKELIKRLRDIRQELGKHKEIDDARRKVESSRRELHSLFSDVKNLERELAEARAKCDAAYSEVLSERKSAYEQRQHNREERRHKQYEELKTRVREERRKQYDDEIKPYMKDYDETVSMDEICQIEKKEKKKEE